MKCIDKHGLTITGLRKASGETVNWSPRSGGYTEVFYDISTGEVWTVDQVSLGHNSWTVYHDKDVIKICDTEYHMTMQEIADSIRDAVAAHNAALEDRRRQQVAITAWEKQVDLRARAIMADPSYKNWCGERLNYNEACSIAIKEVS